MKISDRLLLELEKGQLSDQSNVQLKRAHEFREAMKRAGVDIEKRNPAARARDTNDEHVFDRPLTVRAVTV